MLLDRIRSLSGKPTLHNIVWDVDPYEGLDFVISERARKDPEQAALEDSLFGMKYVYLKSLHEQSLAKLNADGFNVSAEVVASLDENFCFLFELPPAFTGQLKTRIAGNTGQASFSVSLDAILPDGIVHDISLYGPFIKVGETELYRLSPAQYQAIHASDQHKLQKSTEHGEYENNWTIFQLQMAKKAGANIDLAHFNNLEIDLPNKVGVAVEQLPTGDYELTPIFGGKISVADIKSRLGQIDSRSKNCLLRVKNSFVILDEERLEATNEILSNRIIPKQQIKSFFESPTAYLNSALIDFDMGFSLRVKGAERFVHLYFGDVEKSGADWFEIGQRTTLEFSEIEKIVESEEDLTEIENKVKAAENAGATVIVHDDKSYTFDGGKNTSEVLASIRSKLDRSANDAELDVKPDQETPAQEKDRAVVAIDPNDDEEGYTVSAAVSPVDIESQSFDRSNLKRTPFPHQDEGIKWILAHTTANADTSGGALLADDMGLGKSYMTLVAMAEWMGRFKKQSAGAPRPYLIVAPLSLISNWVAELEETFHQLPFSDIVVLQSGSDLRRYKVAGTGTETRQDFLKDEEIVDPEKIRYSLKIGRPYGSERLDMPARLVITTYQTLRDYQFSLSRVDWEMAVFDEAQNIKNPNALVTRAAKGLKSRFKLLATGTPVENSLRDFWCLMDCAVPGLLGAWRGFRAQYIEPILSADTARVGLVKIQIGTALRERVGLYMLRRTKLEKLPGLPQKIVYSGRPGSHFTHRKGLGLQMKGAQLQAYDDIVHMVKNSDVEDRRKLVLPSLHKLRVISICHCLMNSGEGSKGLVDMLDQTRSSAKFVALLSILREIKERKEKVLIFAMTKSVQALVAAVIAKEFQIRVDIVNGDTKAVSSREGDETRKVIIDSFQTSDGFGALVMSPIAAGVGLTIVGANNVVHLERHWNPAKEAQATDRVYRIGQTRTVNVYLPMALHPVGSSFDEQLDLLLSKKLDLSEAVVAVADISAEELSDIF